ncbi:hypothetical protein ACM66B_001344 [Microbotryomycetes sp. NB124-2]
MAHAGTDRFRKALELFYQAHEQDPKGESVEYHRTLASWVERARTGSAHPFAFGGSDNSAPSSLDSSFVQRIDQVQQELATLQSLTRTLTESNSRLDTGNASPALDRARQDSVTTESTYVDSQEGYDVSMRIRDLSQIVQSRLETLENQLVVPASRSLAPQTTVGTGQMSPDEVVALKNKRLMVERLRVAFRERLVEALRAEMTLRQREREVIERQLKIVNPNASRAEIEQALSQDIAGTQVFAQALSSARTTAARDAFSTAKVRNDELRDVESMITDLASLINNMGMIVYEQDTAALRIEQQAFEIEEDTREAHVQVSRGRRFAAAARRKRWWFFGIFSQRKTVLITGAAGYIGSHIALCCLLSGQYSVVTIDNFHNSFPESLRRVSQIAISELPKDASEDDKKACEIQLYKGDLTLKDDIEKIFKEHESKGGIYAVIHVAAHKAVGESGEKPIQYYENNITATVNLLAIMEKHNVNKIVYSSSATVYGAPKTIPIPESCELAPESVYGRTKYMTEWILKDLADSNPNLWRAIALRYFNPAGSHPSGEIGEDPRGRPGNLLPLLAQIAAGKIANDLKVFGNDYPTVDGTCVRDYVHIMDLAQGHVDALNALENDAVFKEPTQIGGSGFGGSGGKYKAYNLGNGKGQSVMQMVEAMRKATGFDYKYEIVGRRTGDVPELVSDPSNANKELNFQCKYGLDEMAKHQWAFYQKYPQGYETKK